MVKWREKTAWAELVRPGDRCAVEIIVREEAVKT